VFVAAAGEVASEFVADIITRVKQLVNVIDDDFFTKFLSIINLNFVIKQKSFFAAIVQQAGGAGTRSLVLIHEGASDGRTGVGGA
jgi:hypothetical protein